MAFITKNIFIWGLIIFLVVLSSFFSACETALSSCNKLRIKKMASDGNKRAKLVWKINEQYEKALTALLIGNTVLNIIVSTIGAVIFTRYFDGLGPGVSTVFFTIVLLTFAEIVPKTYANSKAEKVCIKNVYFIRFCTLLFTPLIFLFDGVRKIINKFVVVEKKPQITEQELKFMLDDIKGQGILEDVEGDLAKSALDLDEIVAKEVMTPRVDLVAIQLKDDVEDVKDVFLTKQYSRLPVYEEYIDNIVGIINEKDFFKKYLSDKTFDVKDILKKPLLIPPQINISQLMRKFQKDKTHMAVVVDQYGGVEGIITFEDIIKQLVGDVYDGKDIFKMKDIVKISDGVWRINPDVSANVLFREICSDGVVDLQQGSTVAGLILQNLGRLAKVGDSFIFQGFEIFVEKMQDKRIVEVLIKKI